MFLNKLYTIKSFITDNKEENLVVEVVIDRYHPLFDGHFPGNPILPGVCTVQIAKELVEKMMKRKLMLVKAGNIKYLGFINPVSTPEIKFELCIKNNEEGNIYCSVSVSAGGSVLCSFKGEYK